MAVSRSHWSGWKACVCPECRTVFRVETPHLESFVICPACETRLSLGSSQTIHELERFVAPDLELEQAGRLPSAEERSANKRKREGLDWDQKTKEISETSNASTKAWRWVSAVGGVLAVIIVATGTYLLVSEKRNESLDLVGSGSKYSQEVEDELKRELPLPQVTNDQEEDDFKEITAKAERLIREIREAKDVDVLYQLMYPERGVKESISAHLKDHKKNLAIVQIDENKLNRFQNGYLFSVILEDFSEKFFPVIILNDQFKLDWFAYIEASELPIAELKKKLPLKSVELRVILRPVPFYNRDFSDENRWVSYQLMSMKDDDSLFCYVEKDGEVYKNLRELVGDGERKVIVKVRYPENPKANNQVILDEIVSTNWSKHLEPLNGK